MAQLTIKVGASIDRSMSVAHRPLIESAKRAKAAIEKEGKAAGEAIAKETKKGTDAADKEFEKLAKSAEKWRKQMVRDAEKAIRDETRAHEKGERDKTRATEREAAQRNREREKQLKTAAKTAKENNERALGFVGGAGSAFAGAGKSAVRAGLGVAGELARGAGVDLDLGSYAKKNTDLAAKAVDVSNSGYLPGKAGPAGVRQDPQKIIDEVRKVAMGTGQTSGDVMGGLQAFTAKTGDLETGRTAMFELAKLSKASGSDIHDMLDAAGDVSNALGETENKGEKVHAVMAAIAAQGKLGAVEIKDLATQLTKVAASAGQFEGSTQRTISEIGAMVQMARSAKGGSSSPQQAATSATSFMSTFSKGARLKQFEAFGVKTQGAGGMIRDPRAIILDALKAGSSKEHGGLEKLNLNMGKMFMDAQARRAVRGFETVYKQAGGGEAGLEATKKAFDELADSVMNQAEINDSFAAAMATDATKANQFNEQMAIVVADISKNLAPALKDLAPLIIDTAKGFASLAGTLTGSTGNAVDEKGRKTDRDAHVAASDLRITAHDTGKVTKGQLAGGEKSLVDLDAQIALKKSNMQTPESVAGKRAAGWAFDHTPFGAIANKVLGTEMGKDVGNAARDRAEQDRQQLASQLKERSELAKLLTDIKTGTMKVEIVADQTAPPGDGPPKLPTGRTPAPENKPR